ncbi:hypothetical protein [Erythrobacter crassostreae]|uniref:Uncharacterized protein n=1 Tax=Erythrobacter crassostreae TaxID=2828328 RepID=A0A9X1F435_9SPHN|nr:hypothetical protein [Erythrobacter crassostrea]MBV7259906.1 hypothetical protein [Erythrobacter crassostrea]
MIGTIRGAFNDASVSNIGLGTSGLTIALDKQAVSKLNPPEEIVEILPSLTSSDIQKLLRVPRNFNNTYCRVSPDGQPSTATESYAKLVELNLISTKSAISPIIGDSCPDGQFLNAKLTDEGRATQKFFLDVLGETISIIDTDE